MTHNYHGESLTYNLKNQVHTYFNLRKMIYFRIDGKNVFIKDRKNVLAIAVRFSNGCREVLTLLLWRSLCADSKNFAMILVDYRANCCPKANMVDDKAR